MSEKAHLLLIDDEKNYLLVLQTLLEDEGYAVTAISDPETALAFLDESEVDVIVTDMKNGALEHTVFFQGVFNDKAFRGLDVFEVNTAEGGAHQFHKFHDFCGVPRVHADGEGIDIAKRFEQQGFSFHNGHGGGSADISQPKHGGSVGNDADEVGMIGVDIKHGGVFMDFHAGFGNTGGVGQGEVVIIAHGGLDANLDFSLKLFVHGQSFFPQVLDT